ncbi:MAG: gliding motility protein GldM [Bacteroidales bacterium]|nr:gliding motility protein GldM [Bacteroidales bacterium]
MAGYKETPRQKMIAMMYLVLTALLALNVSVEIIEAFVIVNKSIEGTNVNLKSKNDETYARFEQQNQLNQAKVGPFWDKAQNAKKLSDDLITFIEQVKFEAIAKSEGITTDLARTTELRDIQAKDKYDVTTNYFIGNSQDGSKGKSRELKDRIELFKKDIVNLLDEKDRTSIQLGLDTKGPFRDASGAKQNWEMHNFYHIILAANVTFLNKLIADVRSVEGDVVTKLLNSVTSKDFKFDVLNAKVIPSSKLVFKGDTYEAEIMVAAVDSKQDPEVIIGGRRLPTENGVAKYTVSAGATGLQSYKGSIKVKDPEGNLKNYDFEESYFVMSPSLTVAPTKMNVFYANVDNPVSISASGIPESQISADITTGTIKRASDGKTWVVRVPLGQKAVITVKHNDGKATRNMGNAEFRIKRVPDPKAYIANTDGGPVQKSMLLASRALIPKMPEDFDFDLNFEIVSFTFVGVRGGDTYERPGTGNRLTDEMQTFISNSKRGQRIWLENIMAKGPDGNRKLGTISLIVQ